MIDSSAFHSLSYGLYVIGTTGADGDAGCIANTFQQVTSSPFQVSVALNNDNVTTGRVLESGRFTAACLSEEASMELIGRFGFHTSADTDKFDGVAHEKDAAGVPYVTESSCAWFSARVVNSMNLGTHTMIVGEVEEAGTLDSDAPMTYAYYHMVKGGKTPPKASSFIPGDADASPAPSDAAQAISAEAGAAAARTVEHASAAVEAEAACEGAAAGGATTGWRCKVCGYIVPGYPDGLPADFTCPCCGVGPEMFEPVEL